MHSGFTEVPDGRAQVISSQTMLLTFGFSDPESAFPPPD